MYYTRRRLYHEIILYKQPNTKIEYDIARHLENNGRFWSAKAAVCEDCKKSCVFGFYLAVASFAKGPTFTRTNPRLSPSSNLSWLFNHNSIENKSGQIPGIQFSMFLT